MGLTQGRKFPLDRMLAEIQRDEAGQRKRHQQLSQAEIRKLFADRKSNKKIAP
jgi:hypothetical protein